MFCIESAGTRLRVKRDRWDIDIWNRGAEAHIDNVNHTLTDLDEGKGPSLMKQGGLKIEREELVEGMPGWGSAFF